MEYFTAMSEICNAYGGTLDQFIGDAMLIFFGDPQTKGARGDAEAAVGMALAMQEGLKASVQTGTTVVSARISMCGWGSVQAIAMSVISVQAAGCTTQ